MNLGLKLFLNLFLPQLVWAQGEIQCHPKSLNNGDHIDRVVSVCEEESAAQGRDYLSWKISEDVRICRAYHPSSESSDYLQCVRSSVSEAYKILTCTDRVERYREVVESDLREMKVRLSRCQPAQTPERIQRLFSKLTDSADQHFQYKFAKPAWALHGYQDLVPNATAAISGDILISEALWNSDKGFPENEIAAIMAHEIAHVVQDHMLHLGCLAIEWMGPKMTIGEALEGFRDDLAEGFPRKERWKKVSQSLELEADRIGIEILRVAGFDEESMVQVLKRLASQSKAGFSSGSHPEFDERIRRAEEAVRASKTRSQK